jgi:hypothetical protein
MNKHPFIFLIALLCITAGVWAQAPAPVTLEDGTTKTTTNSPIQSDGSFKTTDEFKFPDGTLRGYRITINYPNGNIKITDSLTTPGGRPWRVTVVKKYSKEISYYKEERNYDDRGKTVLEYQVREYMGNGYLKITTFRAGQEKKVEETTIVYDPGELIPMHPGRDKDLPISQNLKMKPTLDVTGGYSYLYTKTEYDNISFPVGGHVSLTLMLTKKFGLLVDGSYHTKKENDLRVARAFLMGGVMYNILKKEQEKLMLFARLMAGLAADRQKYLLGPADDVTKAKALAIAVGLGIAYPINSSLFICLIPDYIYNKFNETNYTNIRVTAALKVYLQGQ